MESNAIPQTHGGMQSYMRRIAEIMSSVCQKISEPLISVSVTDSGVKHELHPNPCQYDKFIPASGSKVKFLSNTLTESMLYRHRVMVVGHLGLASTAYVLWRMGMVDHYIIVLHLNYAQNS